MRGHFAGRDRRTGVSRQEVVAGGQHVHATGEPRSQRVKVAFPSSPPPGSESLMSSVAVSCLLVDEDAELRPASIADEVASMARKDLAPLAAAIDDGAVY